jgi:charged multivesicular body protein 2A
MVRMNQQIDMKSMAGIIMEFEKQSEILEQKEEMIGDAMDDMMDVSDEEAETEDVVDQILTEIGIDLAGELGAAPSQKPVEPVEVVSQGDKELEARLENLRRG